MLIKKIMFARGVMKPAKSVREQVQIIVPAATIMKENTILLNWITAPVLLQTAD